MINSTLCYIEKDGKYLMLHRSALTVKHHKTALVTHGAWRLRYKLLGQIVIKITCIQNLTSLFFIKKCTLFMFFGLFGAFHGFKTEMTIRSIRCDSSSRCAHDISLTHEIGFIDIFDRADAEECGFGKIVVFAGKKRFHNLSHHQKGGIAGIIIYVL